MSSELLDPEVLWADDHGICCDCCAGYCPADEWSDASIYSVRMVRFSTSGNEYVGSVHSVVRCDLVEPLPATVVENALRPTVNPEWATIPTRKPKRVTGPQSANLLDRFDRSGLTMHDGGEKIAHLYRGSLHVGWTALAKGASVCNPADLGVIQRIAIETGLTIHLAHQALTVARAAS